MADIFNLTNSNASVGATSNPGEPPASLITTFGSAWLRDQLPRCQDAVTTTARHVDNARVVTTDTVATNGIIHVIDAVVLPKDK